jgi:WD40 repeat protein
LPPSPVIGLDNFSQLVQLHDYTPDLNAATGKQETDYSPYNPVLSPDGKTFAVPVGFTGNTRALYILDVASGDLASSIPLGDSTKRIYGWAFSHDGQKLLFSTYPDGQITVWDIAAGKVDRLLLSKKYFVASDLAFTQDGKQITAVVGDAAKSGAGAALMVWDAASGDLVTQLPADTQYGVDIGKFSADGSRLILSTRNGGKELTVYDTATWKKIARISPPGSAAEVAAISPDGATVVTSRQIGDDILVWDAATGQQISSLQNQFVETDFMVFNPDGSMLVVSGIPPFEPKTDNMYLDASIWDTSTWKQAGDQHWGHFDNLQFAPDGKNILARGNLGVALIGLPDEEILAANQAMLDFSSALGKGDYAAAVSSYFISDGVLGNLKSKGLTSDPAAILKAVCSSGAFPCLPATVIFTSRMAGADRGSVGYYQVLVRFTKPDGSIYADANGATIFYVYVDPAADGSFYVDLPVDYETILKK